MARKAPGRPDGFSAAQNRALRTALSRLKGPDSQTAVGARIGVKQQAVARLLDGGGFSFATATMLVRALGYAGVDDFFVKHRVALPASSPPPRAA